MVEAEGHSHSKADDSSKAMKFLSQILLKLNGHRS